MDRYIWIVYSFWAEKKKKYAWTLGIFWGIMMITNAAIQGGYEIFMLGLSEVCLQTYIFLLPGMVALVSLLITREGFCWNEMHALASTVHELYEGL